MIDEIVNGYGDLLINEPSTFCDILRTFSHIDHDTLGMRMIQMLALELGYRGQFDEDGNWMTNCSNRHLKNYSTHYKPGEATLHQQWWILKLNVGDARWDYKAPCPEISEKLHEIREVLEKEEAEGLWA
jgi:hypothetical protein